MKLTDLLTKGYNAKAWEGYQLPKFDLEAVRAKTHDQPTWLHFGAGNIFRAFPAAILQDVLDQAEGASAAGFSYSVSPTDAGFAAEAAVKFRSGGEEPYRYLELSLFWEEGEWRVSRIGIWE